MNHKNQFIYSNNSETEKTRNNKDKNTDMYQPVPNTIQYNIHLLNKLLERNLTEACNVNS